jgi:hypothetical protein
VGDVEDMAMILGPPAGRARPAAYGCQTVRVR